MTVIECLGWLEVIAWVWLLVGQGKFWLFDAASQTSPPEDWPEVVAIIPARDEADTIGQTVSSLLRQDYPGKFSLVMVDDQSRDGTADEARSAARAAGRSDRLYIVSGTPLPAGWTGKLWAQYQGIAAAAKFNPNASLLLLTDADIEHAPGELRQQVALLLSEGLDLSSLMVRLSVRSLPEEAIVPAFVYFFRMLYPFFWVSNPRRRTAGAAGGYMLVRRSMLESIGGLETIRGSLIDDCALAQAIKKAGGHIRLGMSAATRSLRTYRGWGELWTMIARSAYTQLHYQPMRLIGCVLAMLLVFVAPPFLALAGSPAAMAAWVMMSVSYVPMLRFYRQPMLAAFALPFIAAFYLGATIDSARRHRQGRGGAWKGRVYRAEGTEVNSRSSAPPR